jgi:DNA-binding MarR family transcriptional regulator
VRLTPSGLRRFREIAASHEQWIVELLGGLSQEDRQLMFGILARLKNHLSAFASHKPPRKLSTVDRRK